jgi:hypothetical protein
VEEWRFIMIPEWKESADYWFNTSFEERLRKVQEKYPEKGFYQFSIVYRETEGSQAGKYYVNIRGAYGDATIWLKEGEDDV